jgi:hypothetical protein
VLSSGDAAATGPELIESGERKLGKYGFWGLIKD